MASTVNRVARLGMIRRRILNESFSTMVKGRFPKGNGRRAITSAEDPPKTRDASRVSGHDVGVACEHHIGRSVSRKDKNKFQDPPKPRDASRVSGHDVGVACEHHIGRNVSRRDKNKFLVSTLLDLKDSREAVYGALDSWVAWERHFPTSSLKCALIRLEKEQQWHRIIQIIKWMLSKGQCDTMGTYGQLVRALDMDHRAEEAHNFWMKKIGTDLHSVPWQLCHEMISVYYRNNMLERLVKLFKGLEDFNRKPPEKAIVQKVANAYELLGRVEEKTRVLEKYKDLFTDSWRGKPKNFKSALRSKNKKSGQKASDAQIDTAGQKASDAQIDTAGQKASDAQIDTAGQKASDAQIDTAGQKASDAQIDTADGPEGGPE